jgi:hypothetical protein
MAESTLDLISSHVASGARLMARQKQIIAELKAKGADINDARSPCSPPAYGISKNNGWQSWKNRTHSHMAEKHANAPRRLALQFLSLSQR